MKTLLLFRIALRKERTLKRISACVATRVESKNQRTYDVDLNMHTCLFFFAGYTFDFSLTVVHFLTNLALGISIAVWYHGFSSRIANGRCRYRKTPSRSRRGYRG